MPAFGVNWGKYPALAGLAVLPIPLAFCAFSTCKKTRRKLLFYLAAGILITGLVVLHTRAVIVIGLALAAYFLSRFLIGRLTDAPLLQIALGVVLVAGLIFWVWMRPYLTGLYSNHWLMMILILVLIPSAWLKYPVPTLWFLLFLTGIAILSLTPAPSFLRGYTFELLDRQYVQLSLYFPLAVLGGLGFGLKPQFAGRKWIKGVLVGLISFLIILQLMPTHPFYPDRCCNYVSQDDMLAFTWLAENIPTDGLILIAGLPTTNRIIEIDSGAWVYAVTGIHSRARSFNTNFNDMAVIQELCLDQEEVYIFLGGESMSFPSLRNTSNREVFSPAFSSGKIEVIQLMTCLPGSRHD